MKKLTTSDYWNKNYEKGRINKFNMNKFLWNYSYYLLDKLFQKYLPKNKNAKILEIGCAPGNWLIYFNKRFGYHPYGVEYTKEGYQLTKKNLELNNVKGNIIHSDFLDKNFQKKYKNYFDIVYSFGLIEHFDEVGKVLQKHLNLLKKGGNLIILVPNILESKFYYHLQKILDKDKLKGFIHLSKEDLLKINSDLKLKCFYCNPIGVLNLDLLNIRDSFFLIKLLYHFLIKLTNLFINILKPKRETKIFSPYNALVSKKY